MRKTCETCRWWGTILISAPNERDPRGPRTSYSIPVCKRYPQEVQKEHYDWCGEHAPKQQEAGDAPP